MRSCHMRIFWLPLLFIALLAGTGPTALAQQPAAEESPAATDAELDTLILVL